MHGAELGYILAFLTGLSFALSDVFIRVGSRRVTPGESLLISLLIGSPLLWLASLMIGERPPSTDIIALYALVGVIHFVLGRLLFYIAITGIGASSAAVSSSPTVILSAILAWAFLGEALSYKALVGLLLVTIAVYLGAFHPSGRPLQGTTWKFGLIAGLSASLIFASSTVIVRYAGIVDDSPIMGVAISYTSALIVSMLIESGRLRRIRELASNGGSSFIFVLAGSIVVALAQAFRYYSLDLIPVAHAIILISLFPFHTSIIAHLMGSLGEESIKLRHFVGGALAAAGIYLTLF